MKFLYVRKLFLPAIIFATYISALGQMVHTDNDGFKTVDYSRLAPVLLEGMKEQQKQIEFLLSEINKLKNDLDKVKKNAEVVSMETTSRKQ